MIIIAGTVDVAPEIREKALEETCQLMADTRGQKGCMDYVWSADGAVPGRIYVFERWEDRDSLAAHFEGPYYKNMLAKMASYGLKGFEVYKYRIGDGAQAPVYGKDGKPSADFPDS